jgi:hypothetical protein
VSLAGDEVESIEDKPVHSSVRNTWGMAAWTWEFQLFLHEAVRAWGGVDELSLGQVFSAFLASGAKVRSSVFSGSTARYVDIGTAAGLVTAWGAACGEFELRRQGGSPEAAIPLPSTGRAIG